jgi:hypothetical protein
MGKGTHFYLRVSPPWRALVRVCHQTFASRRQVAQATRTGESPKRVYELWVWVVIERRTYCRDERGSRSGDTNPRRTGKPSVPHRSGGKGSSLPCPPQCLANIARTSLRNAAWLPGRL